MTSLYQLTSGTSIIRTSDGASIPADPANRDYADYQTWLAIAGNTPDPYVPPPPPIPQSILRRQFYQQLATQGIIANADALTAVTTGTLPSTLQTLVNELPTAQQFPATMMLAADPIFERTNPVTLAIGAAYGWTSAQIDAFFTAASAL